MLEMLNEDNIHLKQMTFCPYNDLDTSHINGIGSIGGSEKQPSMATMLEMLNEDNIRLIYWRNKRCSRTSFLTHHVL